MQEKWSILLPERPFTLKKIHLIDGYSWLQYEHSALQLAIEMWNIFGIFAFDS